MSNACGMHDVNFLLSSEKHQGQPAEYNESNLFNSCFRLQAVRRMFGEVLFTLTIFVFMAKTHLVDVKEEPVSIVFAGDISFDGTVRYHVRKGYHSYNDSFRQIARYLREADLAVANYESPFVTKEMIQNNKADKGSTALSLKADANSASSLSYAGFDLVCLANNHMNDYGDVSANFTVKRLHDVGVRTFGISYGPTYSPQEPVIMDVRGVKIGFLAYCLVVLLSASVGCEELRSRYNAGPAPYRYHDAARDIEILKNQVDIVAVFMHWGKEYYMEPLKSELRMAKELKSLGVHVIIGCHPHVLQPHCYDGDHVMAFSLGNFLFPWHVSGGNVYFMKNRTKQEIEFYEKSVTGCMPPTKASRLFRVWVNKRGVVKADYLPLEIEFNPSIKCLQPKPIKGAKWIEVCGPDDKACTKCP